MFLLLLLQFTRCGTHYSRARISKAFSSMPVVVAVVSAASAASVVSVGLRAGVAIDLPLSTVAA